MRPFYKMEMEQQSRTEEFRNLDHVWPWELLEDNRLHGKAMWTTQSDDLNKSTLHKWSPPDTYLPIVTVSWSRWFWSTFKMVNFRSSPG